MNIGVVVDNEFDHDHRVQKEIRLLQDEGHTIFVLCFDFKKTYKTYPDLTVNRVRIHRKLRDLFVLLSTNFKFYERLWKNNITQFIINNNLDALHVHDLYLAKAAKKGIQQSTRNIPLTLDLHENYPAAINSYEWAIKGWRKYVVQPQKWYKKEGEYLKYADHIIVLSNSFKQNLLARFPFLKSETLYVHPNMPDFESFQAFEKNEYAVKFDSKLPTLFYFGVVAKRRGIMDILPWIIELLEEGDQFHTLIIGPTDKADKAEFQRYINHPGLKDHLTYIPWADVKYLPAYLKKITIGLAPFQVNAQHDSGVANKLFQYMYGEIPILATKCKAQQELIESAACGLLYETKEEFKTELKRLITNPSLRQELGKNGKQKLLELYKNQADRQFLKIYRE
ncbi:glycosyltransferase family 4 protein [Gelidibacter sp.]|uniref:glycosyltransferase family 4 protein n=1 Tax=Gelidibacter sp. TaxID=2018083 RepID=UPI002C8FDD20|nr:glycosyltransferase family 4 protein [Gelidibacter sp.]HUH28102.1 glycosyltransferase family 4 protein [Gelidibacter sp.]